MKIGRETAKQQTSSTPASRVIGLIIFSLFLATPLACRPRNYNGNAEQSSFLGGSKVVEDGASRFIVEKQLGEGNFATVFRARKESSGEILALKVYKDQFRTDAFESLLRSAYTLTRDEVWRPVYQRYGVPRRGTLSEKGLIGEGQKREVLFVEGELADGYLSKLFSEFRHETDPYIGSELVRKYIAFAEDVAVREWNAGIVHGDISSENIFYTGKSSATIAFRLGDLDSVRKSTDPLLVAQPHVSAPEVIFKVNKRPFPAKDFENIGAMADYFSAGLALVSVMHSDMFYAPWADEAMQVLSKKDDSSSAQRSSENALLVSLEQNLANATQAPILPSNEIRAELAAFLSCALKISPVARHACLSERNPQLRK